MSQTILDLDSLLDSTLDNVADVPDYQIPPAGLYKLAVNKVEIDEYSTKKAPTEKQKRIKLEYKVVATVQLGDTKDLPVADGTLFSENFSANEDGLAFFKKQAKKVLNVSDLNGVSLRDVFASLQGAEFDAKLTIKKSKSEDGSTEYENVRVAAMPPAA